MRRMRSPLRHTPFSRFGFFRKAVRPVADQPAHRLSVSGLATTPRAVSHGPVLDVEPVPVPTPAGGLDGDCGQQIALRSIVRLVSAGPYIGFGPPAPSVPRPPCFRPTVP